MSFWEIITSGSELPVNEENTFWMHVTNQKQFDFDARNTYAVRKAGTIAVVQELDIP